MGQDDEIRRECEEARARRGRNVALALVLFVLVVLFFIMTLIRVKP
jgi:hypothetical protein